MIDLGGRLKDKFGGFLRYCYIGYDGSGIIPVHGLRHSWSSIFAPRSDSHLIPRSPSHGVDSAPSVRCFPLIISQGCPFGCLCTLPVSLSSDGTSPHAAISRQYSTETF